LSDEVQNAPKKPLSAEDMAFIKGNQLAGNHSGVAQGRAVDRDSRDLCLDGLGKKKASDEKKQGKMRLCNGTGFEKRNPAKKVRGSDAYRCILTSLLSLGNSWADDPRQAL
jgi:hypothetical protein